VSGDTNGKQDVFVRDRQTGQTSRVSVATNGGQANSDSFHPAISADGRFVAFSSRATNLVSGDTNGMRDVFVRDRQTGQTSRVSVATNGGQANSDSGASAISADGRYIAFVSSARNLVPEDIYQGSEIFVRDRLTGQTTRVGRETAGNMNAPAISADGRFVAFHSFAPLVGPDSNGAKDVFVTDRQTGQTTRVSVGADGSQANGSSESPSISADGRFVAFSSIATNLVPLDTNGVGDVFVHDRQTGRSIRVGFRSVDIILGPFTSSSKVVQANGQSGSPVISADGRHVAFSSLATNFVSGDTNGKWDIFVLTRETGQISRVSVASGGSQADDSSDSPAISADGRFVAFSSLARNLVATDTNGMQDIFVTQ
jgi:Tol biopolymer transport system component